MFTPKSPREDLLLLCVARLTVDATTSNKIQRLLSEGSLDWDYISETARAHGVTALLAHHLQSFSALVADRIMSELQDANQLHVQQCLFLTGQLAKIVAALNTSNILCLAFKGPTLAALAYEDVALRQFADLDLLVRERDVERARDTLRQQGFSAVDVLSPKGEAALLRFDNAYAFRNSDEVILDLHWRFAPRYFSMPLETEDLWPRAEPVKICEQTVLTLSPEDLLVMLCCHGYTHEWQRLVWICDVASLSQHRLLDWNYVLREARQRGLLRIVFVGLLLARELGASLPALVNERLEGDGVSRKIAVAMGSEVFGAKAGGQGGRFDSVRTQLAIRERIRDKAKFLWRFSFVPRYYDWRFAPLPASLSPLYYLIRPIRIARDCARRLMTARSAENTTA